MVAKTPPFCSHPGNLTTTLVSCHPCRLYSRHHPGSCKGLVVVFMCGQPKVMYAMSLAAPKPKFMYACHLVCCCSMCGSYTAARVQMPGPKPVIRPTVLTDAGCIDIIHILSFGQD